MSPPSHAQRHGALNAASDRGGIDPEKLEVAPGTARQAVEGWVPELATEDELRSALEQAFDYRGDVTITRKNGGEVTGYLFDRRVAPTLESSVVRLILASGERPTVSYSEIAAIAFTGRDTAAGKSYEAWVKKYWEKRAKGEKNISIEPEVLE